MGFKQHKSSADSGTLSLDDSTASVLQSISESLEKISKQLDRLLASPPSSIVAQNHAAPQPSCQAQNNDSVEKRVDDVKTGYDQVPRIEAVVMHGFGESV